ncbi:hypothetical protein Terro_3327 [Terriglobus roseus DSM 18391]|uniref:Alginate export domain-containing protein n=1 Tax=Terriglobus roseus (strain DSM 18391 / NRRL B-41598 / KBS 63) TaxID=926566 RepID=I3ZJX6_TERRK|nr:alginate export family protein [Terriglobus roseus]AFL89544.1 hypothetical protein Terro_3327 [Terriglobus roseus DSM 18391]
MALRIPLFLALAGLPCTAGAQIPTPDISKPTPLTVSVWDRQRVNVTQWFSATPNAALYGHVDSLLRIALQQRIKHIDWTAELSQNSELWLPNDAVSPVAAQGQLGLGGSYYASNGNNRFPAAASFKQGWLRYHFKRDSNTLRVGRFEFTDGTEMKPEDKSLLWLQNNRMSQRLLGSFGFSNGQRSLDGVDAHITGKQWDITAMGARSVQGVFNMNANPELDVDVQYLAYSRFAAKKHVLFRTFALGFHDGRTGVLKTDNRPQAVRQLDHKNIRIGTYGTSMIAAIPVTPAIKLDGVFWGVLQNGRFGVQDHRAGGLALEGGIQFTKVKSSPWLRYGFLRTTGDENPNDNTHNTFFAVLPTPRNYARFPFFNTMNSKESFLQLIDKPTPKLDIRTDLHFLGLTSGNDLWYLGGGALDKNTFGYMGRPANGHNSLATLYDFSADYQLTQRLALTAYYAHVWGKEAIKAIYPVNTQAQFGFLEVNYRFSAPLTHPK